MPVGELTGSQAAMNASNVRDGMEDSEGKRRRWHEPVY